MRGPLDEESLEGDHQGRGPKRREATGARGGPACRGKRRRLLTAVDTQGGAPLRPPSLRTRSQKTFPEEVSRGVSAGFCHNAITVIAEIWGSRLWGRAPDRSRTSGPFLQWNVFTNRWTEQADGPTRKGRRVYQRFIIDSSSLPVHHCVGGDWSGAAAPSEAPSAALSGGGPQAPRRSASAQRLGTSGRPETAEYGTRGIDLGFAVCP
jgi:hypothetical protein